MTATGLLLLNIAFILVFYEATKDRTKPPKLVTIAVIFCLIFGAALSIGGFILWIWKVLP